MFRAQLHDAIHIPDPDFKSLVWKSGDQIQVDVVESKPPQHCKIVKHGSGPVDSSGSLQILIFEGLGAQTDPIDSDLTIPCDLFGRDSSRVHFNGYFSVRFREQSEHSGKQFRRNYGGCPSSKVDGSGLIRDFGHSDFIHEPANVRFVGVFRSRRHGESTVVTTLFAKRNVDIDSLLHSSTFNLQRPGKLSMSTTA